MRATRIANAVVLQARAIAAAYGLQAADVMLLAGFANGDFCVRYSPEAIGRVGELLDFAGPREGAMMADIAALVDGTMALELS